MLSSLEIRHGCWLFLAMTALLHLWACPHSKVEESFHLQATHDLYYHGISPNLWRHDANDMDELPYDHLKFPGVVPRTFAGSAVLALLARCIDFCVTGGGLFWWGEELSPCQVQFLIRFLLMGFNLHALWRLASALPTIQAGNYFLCVCAAQFHLPFYMSRLLPNTFALGFVIHSYADWWHSSSQNTNEKNKKWKRRCCCMWLVAATAMFRCDILLLLFAVGLSFMVQRYMSIGEALQVGIVTGVVSLAMTVPLDSLLWQQFPCWPEGMVLWFNTIDNRSSEWGTEPWWWYFGKALPRALLGTTVLIPLSFLHIPNFFHRLQQQQQHWWKPSSQKQQSRVTEIVSAMPILDGTMVPFLIPVMGFVALYSFLPHKEMRFIFPALPMLNAAAGHALAGLHEAAVRPNAIMSVDNDEPQEQSQPDHSSRIRSWWALWVWVGGIMALLVTAMGSLLFLAVSTQNYPGGQALTMLQHHVAQTHQQQPSTNNNNCSPVHVYIDVAAAMSGVSLFGQREASFSVSSSSTTTWAFTKSGYESEHQQGPSSDTSSFTHLLTEESHVDGFRIIGIAPGQPRIDFRNRRISTQDTIYILERTDYN